MYGKHTVLRILLVIGANIAITLSRWMCVCMLGDAEKARTENAAPKCRGGNGENRKVGKSRTLKGYSQPTQVIADFEEAPTSAVLEVFGVDVVVSGCWFHYAQALVKRTVYAETWFN